MDTTKVLDVSWHMPNLTPPRNGTIEFETLPRIPQAIRWDLDEIATPKSSKDDVYPKLGAGGYVNELGLGHMMPSPKKFAEACQARGIKRGDHVVVYDTVGVFSSPRGAWTFSVMGHENVSVLDGGLPRYRAELGESALETGEPKELIPSRYPEPTFEESSLKQYKDMVSNSEAQTDQSIVLDARPRERWSGSAPEPRPGLSSGHMPGSLTLPFGALLLPASPSEGRPYTMFRPVEELKEVVIRALASTTSNLNPAQDAGITPEERKIGEDLLKAVIEGKKSVIATCGSGMTACIVLWALKVIIAANPADAYDGGEKTGRKFDALTALLILVPILTGALGIWQIQRLQWKLNLIDEVDRNMAREPMILPDEIRCVKLTPSFHPRPSLFY